MKLRGKFLQNPISSARLMLYNGISGKAKVVKQYRTDEKPGKKGENGLWQNTKN